MHFQLKAIDPNGHVEFLALNAYDEASAREQLSKLGYVVLASRRRIELFAWLHKHKRRFPVEMFSQELLVLLGAGMPLVEAIEALAEKEKQHETRTTLTRVIHLLRQGQPFSVALEQQYSVFDTLYIATIRASERTSDIIPALERYIDYQRKADAIRKRLINASIYPALLLAVGSLVSMFLLLYVVPRFSHIYEERSTELPFFSRMLITAGQNAGDHLLLIGGILGLLFVFVWRALKAPDIRNAISRSLWQSPYIGERTKAYQLARFYRTSGMLLRGGMPLIQALELAADLLPAAMRTQLAHAISAISQGQPVSPNMASCGLTTSIAERLLSVGERGGNMSEMMDRIAMFHDEELARWVDRATRLFEPVLMTFIGLVIGAIVVLMYMPIFEFAGSLN